MTQALFVKNVPKESLFNYPGKNRMKLDFTWNFIKKEVQQDLGCSENCQLWNKSWWFSGESLIIFQVEILETSATGSMRNLDSLITRYLRPANISR